MAKKAGRVRNWGKYNQALVKRGSATFWIDEEAIQQWLSTERSGKKGRPKKYSDIAIKCSLAVKAVYKLGFRETEGFIRSILTILKINTDVPDYTLLCKRQTTLAIKLSTEAKSSKKKVILVDTTGIKVFGEGEWKVRQHGYVKKRLWRKLHLAVDAESQEINAFELTDLGVQDCQGLPLLMDKVECEQVIGDGAFDRFSCYEIAEKHGFELIAPPQHNARTSEERPRNKHKASKEAVRKRDNVIKEIQDIGKKEWKIKAGYHRRSLVETAVFRLKRLISNRCRNKILSHQKIEIAIWCEALNKMTSLGFGR